MSLPVQFIVGMFASLFGAACITLFVMADRSRHVPESRNLMLVLANIFGIGSTIAFFALFAVDFL